MSEQEKSTGPNKQSKLHHTVKLRETVCVDILILRMLILGTETDNTDQVAEAVQLLRSVINRQGYEL